VLRPASNGAGASWRGSFDWILYVFDAFCFSPPSIAITPERALDLNETGY
jgi:hypothetical protein